MIIKQKSELSHAGQEGGVVNIALNTDDVTAIILAGGYSSRMGAFKPLLKLGSITAAEHAVRSFKQAGIQDVRMVVGYRADEIANAVGKLGVRVVFNPAYDKGMFSSVQTGAGSLEPGIQAFYLLPVDYPLVMASTVSQLLCFYRAHSYSIVYPTYQGCRGHPPLISTRYLPSIIRHGNKQGGMRELLKCFDQGSFDLEVDDEAVLLDMDTPDDYQRLQLYLKRRAIPSPAVCRRILLEEQPDGRTQAHCEAVARYSLLLVKRLNMAGAQLDTGLVVAAALLHDVARQWPDHARVGAGLIRNRGYPKVAEVIADHMDLEVLEDEPLKEAELLFLADKMVRGGSPVSLKERFALLLNHYAHESSACRAVKNRYGQALRVKRKVESILGCPVEALAPEALSQIVSDAEVEEDDHSHGRRISGDGSLA